MATQLQQKFPYSLGWWDRLWKSFSCAKIPSRRSDLQADLLIVAAYLQWKGTSRGLLMLPHLPAAPLLLFCWAVTRCKCGLHCVHVIYITSLQIIARDKKAPSPQPALDMLEHCLPWHFPNAGTTRVWSWQIVFCVLSWTQIKTTPMSVPMSGPALLSPC